MLTDALRVIGEWFAALADRLGPFYRERIAPALGGLWRFIRTHWLRIGVYGAITAFALVLAFTGFVYGMYLSTYDRLDTELTEYKRWLYSEGEQERKPPILIYDVNRRLIGEYLPVRGSHMTMRVCSQMDWLNKATVASEDRFFYEHGGVSFRGVFRAFVINLMNFSLSQGGGSITQQLARNLWTDRARSLYRKLYETFSAYLIESRFTKDEILCLYLNKIYMGEGRIGAEEAARFYFRKPPEKLNAAEAAMIVGLFPAPVAYSPLNNITLSLRKQRVVLNRMQIEGLLEEKDKNLALSRFLKRYSVEPKGEPPSSGDIGLYGASRDFGYNRAPTANEYVKEFLYDSLPPEEIEAGGLRVFTTIDAGRQRAALNAVRGQVAALRAKLIAGSKGERSKLERIARRMQGALVSLDSQTGDIRAVVGGYGIREGGMTQRVWSMRRQPGSAIKGMLYAVALDEYTLELNTIVNDEKKCFNKYCPRNANRKFLGEMPLRQALAMSVNTVAVQTLDDVGVSTFRNRMFSALDLGFFASRSRFPEGLSLALGAGEVTPLELARVYALVENGGRVVYPRLVTRVENQDGEIVWEDYSRRDEGAIVLSQESCEGAVRLMQHVFDPELGGTARFIGKRRQSNPAYLPFPIAGKTGTVQTVSETRKKFPGIKGSAKDGWFVGLVPGEATIVWLGHDEGAPFQGSGITAASVWAAYAQAGLKGRVDGEWPEIEIIDPEPADSGEEGEDLPEAEGEGETGEEDSLPEDVGEPEPADGGPVDGEPLEDPGDTAAPEDAADEAQTEGGDTDPAPVDPTPVDTGENAPAPPPAPPPPDG